MRLKSIRWRLPLRFLGIVSLTVLLLGTVLFIVLKAYYSEMEQSYLRGASQAIPNNILEILKSEDPQSKLQGYFENVAFLSQTRIQVTDVEGEVIVDTGSPTDYNVGFGVQRYPHEALTQGERRIIEPYIVLQEGVDGQNRFTQDVPPVQTSESRIAESPEHATPTIEDVQIEDEEDVISVVVTAIPPSEEEGEPVIHEIAVYSTNFGISFSGEDVSSEVRSRENLRIEIHDTTGLLAFIEFSEGPAFGRKILSSVAIGFLLAGFIAMGLATAAGWWISQRFSSPLMSLTESTSRISRGDYSSRAEITGEDEFGILARTFNHMAEQVEGTISTLRRFISDAAHELNTPLTALRTNLELISDEKDTTIQNSYLDRALAQAERLEQLTGALLDLSRLESGASEEAMTQLNLSSLMVEEGERYASIAEQEGIAFSLQLPDEDIHMTGRSNQIRRAISNLLDNALKFTPEGGKVTLGLTTEGDSVHLWVEDTGIGIPEEEIPHLFQRFHRAPNASTYPGSGLGLAIVKTVVEAHNGIADVECKEQGAKFNIRLPMDKRPKMDE